MNHANAITAVRTRIEQAMKSFAWRREAADAFEDMGDQRAASSNRRIACYELEHAAELLSIENHLNGVSPE